MLQNFWPITARKKIKVVKPKSMNSTILSLRLAAIAARWMNALQYGRLRYGSFTYFPKPAQLHLFEQENAGDLRDGEILALLQSGKINQRALERKLGDCIRSVRLRRAFVANKIPNTHALDNLPSQFYDFSKVQGVCCENVIGYMPIPVGFVGPLRMNGDMFYVPLATTEGALVASTSRGCKALTEGSGVTAVCTKDAMTRAPVVRLPDISQAK